MKNIILTIASFFMLSQIVALPGDEKDTMSVFINSKVVGQFAVKIGEAGTFVIKKMAAKNIKNISIQIKGSLMSGPAYAKTLEITDKDPVVITENKNHPGFFDITSPELKKKIAAGKKLSLKLVLNPANPQMLMPSKFISLGTLEMK